VLLVSPQPFFAARGTPMNVLQMCRALTRGGYDVDLATYPMGDPVELPGLRVCRAPRIPGIRSVPIGFSWRKVLLDGVLMLRVAGLLARRRYALVHAIEESVFFLLPVTLFGIPLVYDLDSEIGAQLAYAGVVRNGWLLSAVRALESFALRRSRAAITVCRSLSDAARRLCPGVRVFQVEDAPLAEAAQDPDPSQVEALRCELELGDRPTVVYTGNLERYQGIDLLLDATRELTKQLPCVVVVIVGGEPRAVAALRERTRELGIDGAVIAVGARSPTQMAEWMALGHVLVSPRTEGENTPLKLYTYMRSGRPIVATRRLTHTQVLDNRSAILCEPTPEALAAGLVRGLRGGADVRALATRARVLAETEYSAAAFQRKLLAAYGAILGTPSER
jgi:glycosyltransferase involved in cell wall biosynthesis